MATVGELLANRIPPHSLEAERAVLGAILLDGRAVLDQVRALTAGDFYKEAHRKIWSAIVHVDAQDLRPDTLTVREALRATGQFEEAGGDATLALCLEEAAIELEGAVTILRDASTKRQTIQLATEVISAVFEHRSPASDILDAAQRGLSRLGETVDDPGVRRRLTIRGPQHVSAVLNALWASIDTPVTDVIRSPIPELDSRLGGGVHKGELIALGGRPGMSKTALAMQWGGIAARDGHATLIVSREMKNEALARRLLAQHAHVSATGLRRHDLSEDERRRAARALPQLSALPIWFDDEASTIGQIQRRVRAGRFRFVIVDYVQLVRAPDEPSRRLEVTAISNGLKSMATEMDCTVLALSALRRPDTEIAGKGKKRQQRRLPPTIEAFKESGDIEADADIAILLWQPTDESTDREILLAKLRDGASGGSVTLDWDPVHVRFQQLDDALASATTLDPDDPRSEVPF